MKNSGDCKFMELRMNSHQQDKTIQRCIAASIRGTHAVASLSKKQDNDG